MLIRVCQQTTTIRQCWSGYVNKQQPSDNVDQGMSTNNNHQQMLTRVCQQTTTIRQCWSEYVNKQQPSDNVDQGMSTNNNHQTMLSRICQQTTTIRQCWSGYVNKQQQSAMLTRVCQPITISQFCTDTSQPTTTVSNVDHGGSKNFDSQTVDKGMSTNNDHQPTVIKPQSLIRR